MARVRCPRGGRNRRGRRVLWSVRQQSGWGIGCRRSDGVRARGGRFDRDSTGRGPVSSYTSRSRSHAEESDLINKTDSMRMHQVCANRHILADPTGFEPAVSGVTGRRVRPLHYGSLPTNQPIGTARRNIPQPQPDCQHAPARHSIIFRASVSTSDTCGPRMRSSPRRTV